MLPSPCGKTNCDRTLLLGQIKSTPGRSNRSFLTPCVGKLDEQLSGQSWFKLIVLSAVEERMTAASLVD